ncbi:chemosensory receptor B [Elysia marginata]|uniref:Chemosensory receptor B n=1 Tax=Elysia marginata TaxID=1093978 RepID=A0AAV4GLJ4_9GAST|nr:chemosensory receptor B [Elysia marginata]
MNNYTGNSAIAVQDIELSQYIHPNTNVSLYHFDIPDQVFSFMMEFISYGTIFIALFGMSGNTLIIITFARIGLSDSINLSYCALGISDILCITALTWNAICFIPPFLELDLPFLPAEVNVLTGGAVIDMLSKTTAWLTAFISLERCLCVVFPLKVKDIVRPKRTVFIIVMIFFMTIAPLSCVSFYIYVFVDKFDAKRNITLIGVRYRKSSLSDALYDFNFIYKIAFMNTIPLVIVFVCSASLAVHLRRSATWRLEQSSNIRDRKNLSTAHDDKSNRKYAKDTRVAQTVLAIATCFIVLETLGTVKLFVSLTWTEFRPIGAYSRLFKFISRLAFLFSLTNSSVNFIIYYTMGSKFRHTVKRVLCFKRA